MEFSIHRGDESVYIVIQAGKPVEIWLDSRSTVVLPPKSIKDSYEIELATLFSSNMERLKLENLNPMQITSHLPL